MERVRRRGQERRGGATSDAGGGSGKQERATGRSPTARNQFSEVPRSLPLELSVLPDSGGQAFAGDPDNLSHWNSPSYRSKSRTNCVFSRISFQVSGRACGALEADGAEGNRTPDLCSAIAALSQLSYSPESQTHTAPQTERGRATPNASRTPRCRQDEGGGGRSRTGIGPGDRDPLRGTGACVVAVGRRPALGPGQAVPQMAI